MAHLKIRNNTARPFHVGGVMVRPGDTQEVSDEMLPVIEGFIDAGDLEIDGEKPAPKKKGA